MFCLSIKCDDFIDFIKLHHNLKNNILPTCMIQKLSFSRKSFCCFSQFQRIAYVTSQTFEKNVIGVNFFSISVLLKGFKTISVEKYLKCCSTMDKNIHPLSVTNGVHNYKQKPVKKVNNKISIDFFLTKLNFSTHKCKTCLLFRIF
jgi:hypothetical protein